MPIFHVTKPKLLARASKPDAPKPSATIYGLVTPSVESTSLCGSSQDEIKSDAIAAIGEFFFEGLLDLRLLCRRRKNSIDSYSYLLATMPLVSVPLVNA